MTDKELVNFLEEKEIGVGDILKVNYFRMFSEVITGSVVLKTLQFGGRTINTQVGELTLPEEKLYLIIHNDRYGALGMSSQFIKNIILLERRGLTASGYKDLIFSQNIKFKDEIQIVDNTNTSQIVTMFSPDLEKDEDGDEFFRISNAKGIFNCYLQGLTTLKKV